MDGAFIDTDHQKLGELWEADQPYFKAMFNGFLKRAQATHRKSPSNKRNPQRIAAMLKVVGEDLGKLDISWEEHGKSGEGNWGLLLGTLSAAAKEDALVIFRALAHSVQQKKSAQYRELMAEALYHPEWRTTAILQCPDFFRTGREAIHRPANDYSLDDTEMRENAFRVLASLPVSHPMDTEASTLETLTALREIGVLICRFDEWHESIVEVAAGHRDVNVFNAFLQFFPDDIDRPNLESGRPLRAAALQSKTDNVIALLELGADPHACNASGDNALYAAARRGHLPTVQALLSRAKFHEDELQYAKRCANIHATVLAVIDAALAKNAIDHSTHSPGARPL